MSTARTRAPLATPTPGYRDVARRKRAAREDALRRGRGGSDILSVDRAEVEAYLRATSPEIVRHISEGEWTASSVLEAYIARAVLAQDLTNCLTEILFDEAREEARALDEEYATTGKIRGPLHGVPVSFKDQYDIKGVDSTVGFSAWADKPSSTDSLVVALVRAAGGIPITKSNLAQTMFFFECSNPIWGRTLNPYNRSYSCGGSSGGEGALLAMDGAALGWGSDIGGSLRIPAASCGIYSLKPGTGRISMSGVRDTFRGLEGVRSVAGPMGRSVEDLELAARVGFGRQGADRASPPLPYRDVVLPERLRFGYYVSDGFVKASPANQRAVLETVHALRQAGHQCIPFEVPRVMDATECYMALTASDGFQTLTQDLGADPVEPGLSTILLGPSLPVWLRSILAWATRRIFGDSILSRVISACRPCHSVQEYTEWVITRDACRRTFHEEVWHRHNFDGLITPVFSTPAVTHDSCRYLIALAGGSALYSLLNLPVGVLPVTHVRPSDVATVEWTHARVGSGHGSPILERLLYGWPDRSGQGRFGYYNPEKMAGIPVGVQVVGRNWEEEKVVEMMKVVDHALGPRDFGPFCWQEQMD